MTQISISLPNDLIPAIDAMAASDNRNRSNYIANVLTQIAREFEAQNPAPQTASRQQIKSR